MLTLKEWLELVDYKITEGSEWYCNIPGTYSLSFWNGDQDGVSSTCVFDPKMDQFVYLIELCDYKNNKAYRLHDEAIDCDSEAWDGVDFINMKTKQEFLSICEQILGEVK